MLPSPDILNDYPHGKFVLSNLAAKRARQLREGALPLVQIDSRHELTIALAEIAAGKIRAIMPDSTDSLVGNSDVAALVTESATAERGILIPALDEGDIVTIGFEDDAEELTDDGILSLSDLVDEEGDEVEEIAADDDTLSLQDIADQETIEEEGEEEEA
ncbi:DNA-directed RNA polymerase subunit omega [bacterium]|nr:MAG: DNA-directed RNA polymerase subunit omega [bacterium]